MANQEMKICAEEALNSNLEDCARLLFPQEGESTPRLRFNGFEDKWVEATLGELFTERVESNINGEMLSVTMNNGVIKAAENGRFDNSNSDKSHYKVVKVNDIAYNSMRMWQGASGCSAYEGIVSPAYTVVTPVEGIDSNFFAYLFKTPSVIRKFRLHSQGLTSDTWNLKYPAFSKILVSYPKDIEEQRLIASFLSSLDKQISAQQKQLERLKQMKQSCLGLLFPDNQSITPPLRFKGFNGEWRMVMLKDICEINPHTTLPDVFEYVDLESVVGTTMVSHRTERKGSAPSRAQRLAKYGDIFFQTVRPYQRNNYLFKNEEKPYVFSTGYAQIRTNIDEGFLFNAIQTDFFVCQVMDNCTGSSYPAINPTTLSNMRVAITDDIKEQRRIASFFSSLDKQIETQTQQVERLNQVKKACLNQFIA